ncbi:bifunctional folylpolyglutamate synthase/dihydrofolate synthase [Acidomonas methanolica]|uniref:bifunctional folylpolyglutamate synthase/dihydrofolate synthase n=4 Tax=Acidomonas methanolica TaxID=437 RepID=UPI00104461F7|nr:folylpolyglutamate synthase/dihydrofolate synthase family protein [Acidomonas methanolica]GEK99401.1 bifunctional folylpolyglutamate synthase/dihydrofolate synthase [Acidomonas methanolica NBRC 104435]
MGAPARLADEYTGRAGEVLARLQDLYPKLIDLSLDRLCVLLEKLGHPERALPPVIHVAGTNGKGSTCAVLRAIAEAAGWRVHVMTSPHLVSVTERFRVGGTLVTEEALVAALEEVVRVNDGAPITVFEVLTAAGFLIFAREPADLAIIEVGLGGRLDATNVVTPVACAIASISLDHQAFLGETLAAIAAEKAGIMKPGVPVVAAAQAPEVEAVLRETAARVGAPLWRFGDSVRVEAGPDGLTYRDPKGMLVLPLPGLAGPHQVRNAALAVAALRASGLGVPDHAWAGVARAEWPARMQRLRGALAARLPEGWELWLDGGHNPGAGEALAEMLREWRDRPLHLVIGMKQSKDASGFLDPLLDLADTIQAVAETGQHLAAPVEEILAAARGRAVAGPVVEAALDRLRQDGGAPGRVLICGSLYLAGVVLARDGVTPE